MKNIRIKNSFAFGKNRKTGSGLVEVVIVSALVLVIFSGLISVFSFYIKIQGRHESGTEFLRLGIHFHDNVL